MALQLQLGAPASPTMQASSILSMHVPTLSQEQKTHVRQSLQVMQPWRVPFIENRSPDKKMSQIEMMKSVMNWDDAEYQHVWRQALWVQNGDGPMPASMTALTPQTIILGLCVGLNAMFSKEKQDMHLDRLISGFEPNMKTAERALRLLLIMACGPEIYEDHPPIKHMVDRFLPLAQMIATSNANKSRQRQKELLGQLKVKLSATLCAKVDKGKTPQLIHLSRRELIKAQNDRKDEFSRGFGAALDSPGQAVGTAPGYPVQGGRASPQAQGLRSPQSFFSRRTSYSSQALGSPWQKTASPFSETEWNWVETASVTSD